MAALWAHGEFSDAKLGDGRRGPRLVAVAAGAAVRPGGKITEVFQISAEREGAFRFMENEGVAPSEIGAAAHRAAARRAQGLPFVYVPVDQSDVRVIDRGDSKGLGSIGDSKTRARGLQVMNAIAVAPDGTPLGMCGQVYWARPQPSPRTSKKDQRPVTEKETVHWLDAMEQARVAFGQTGTTARLWFQLDRGGDAWPMLLDAHFSKDSWTTVRVANNRRLEGLFEGTRDYLWPRVERQEPLGSYVLPVLGSPTRRPRNAVMQLQACNVVVDVEMWPSKKRFGIPLWAVRAVEVGTAPAGEEPLEWLLLTTYPVNSAEEAVHVLLGYASRWRIEEFHKTWKSGACHVEDTQLRDRDSVERWATILASVAMRIQRLMHLSRTQPNLPATVELSRPEIKAVILLRKPRGVKSDASPTIAEAIRWIADLGGYTGKSSGGPPGAIVISRGLTYIRSAVRLLSEGEM